MSKAERPVLLVGGIPGETAEEVFRTCAPELGNLATSSAVYKSTTNPKNQIPSPSGEGQGEG